MNVDMYFREREGSVIPNTPYRYSKSRLSAVHVLFCDTIMQVRMNQIIHDRRHCCSSLAAAAGGLNRDKHGQLASRKNVAPAATARATRPASRCDRSQPVHSTWSITGGSISLEDEDQEEERQRRSLSVSHFGHSTTTAASTRSVPDKSATSTTSRPHRLRGSSSVIMIRTLAGVILRASVASTSSCVSASGTVAASTTSPCSAFVPSVARARLLSTSSPSSLAFISLPSDTSCVNSVVRRSTLVPSRRYLASSPAENTDEDSSSPAAAPTERTRRLAEFDALFFDTADTPPPKPPPPPASRQSQRQPPRQQQWMQTQRQPPRQQQQQSGYRPRANGNSNSTSTDASGSRSFPQSKKPSAASAAATAKSAPQPLSPESATAGAISSAGGSRTSTTVSATSTTSTSQPSSPPPPNSAFSKVDTATILPTRSEGSAWREGFC